MARYIITDTQLHSVIYKYLDSLIDKSKDEKEKSTYNNRGDYTIQMFNSDGKKLLFYIWYGAGGAYDDDDDTVHNGIGHLQIHPYIVDFIRSTFKIRETKAIDIISDWVSNKIDSEVDTATIYPNREKPTIY